ncbi:WD repeat-containing protein 41 [Platysternon megacephalum]|uniref:WD repeat-containing protein 41 n=1 Tax=Platysternon megacephalum TaxID=55544 RepID=A0A4D9F281_9SAUR|nr:WD repeat-containing protein 41 [Platysternon megacephalum]
MCPHPGCCPHDLFRPTDIRQEKQGQPKGTYIPVGASSFPAPLGSGRDTPPAKGHWWCHCCLVSLQGMGNLKMRQPMGGAPGIWPISPPSPAPAGSRPRVSGLAVGFPSLGSLCLGNGEAESRPLPPPKCAGAREAPPIAGAGRGFAGSRSGGGGDQGPLVTPARIYPFARGGRARHLTRAPGRAAPRRSPQLVRTAAAAGGRAGSKAALCDGSGVRGGAAAACDIRGESVGRPAQWRAAGPGCSRAGDGVTADYRSPAGRQHRRPQGGRAGAGQSLRRGSPAQEAAGGAAAASPLAGCPRGLPDYHRPRHGQALLPRQGARQGWICQML